MQDQGKEFMKAADKPESVRAWYNRTTGTWRKALVWATVVALIAGVALFMLSSFQVLARLQTFNGAFVIPIAALIWMLTFVYVFLVPSREVSFRSQEAIEDFVSEVKRTIDEKLIPTVQVVHRVAERIEKELPRFIEEGKKSIETANKIAVRLEELAKKNDALAQDARPAIEALRKISERIDQELKGGLLDEVRAAAEATKSLAGVPKQRSEPNIGRALQALRKK